MNPVDYVLLFVWIALLFRSLQALVPLTALAVFHLCFAVFDSDFPILTITAAACFALAQVDIRISSDLRYAYLASGSLYWLGSLDELLYQNWQVTSVYFNLMPYLLIFLNAYIAAVIFRDGGPNIVGLLSKFYLLLVNAFSRFMARLYLLSTFKKNSKG